MNSRKMATDRGVEHRVAAIGMFDGVHTGHRHLLDCVINEAHRCGLRPAVITFTAHPSHLLTPDRPVGSLTDTKRKRELLHEAGIEDVIELEFTHSLRSLTSEEFMRMLHERYGVDRLIVGYDNKFGSDRHHSFEDYRRLGRGVGVEVIEATEKEGFPSSSSLIRAHLAAGRVEEAAKCLGRPYALDGIVDHGRALGRTIGFPTANIVPLHSHSVVPARGVYAARVTDMTDGSRYDAMVNIGSRPTVNGNPADVTVEAHLLDFEGDIYDHTLRVDFIARMRQEMRFDSVEALRRRLESDRLAARRLLSSPACRE